MGITLNTCLYNNDFDFKTLKESDIHFCFICRVPFRYRIKGPYRCRFEYQGRSFDIWVRNKVEVPPGDMPLHSIMSNGMKVESLWSDVAIIVHKVRLEDGELEVLRDSKEAMNQFRFQSTGKHIHFAMLALNAFTTAFSTVTGDLFGGQTLRLFRGHDYIEILSQEVGTIAIPLDYWDHETVNELLDLNADRRFQTATSLTGQLHDFPIETLERVGHAISRQSDFIFYELAFEAKAKMLSGDYAGALLMAVAALEGAHGAFVTHRLAKLLPAKSDDLAESFIKELGMSLCNDLTPYLLMPKEDRPPAMLIQQAALGLRYRNEIMHALRNKKGEYKIRIRNNSQIGDAYSAVLQLYTFYIKAFEKLLVTDGQ